MIFVILRIIRKIICIEHKWNGKDLASNTPPSNTGGVLICENIFVNSRLDDSFPSG